MNKHPLSFIAVSAIALLAAPALVAQEPGVPERNRAADEAAVLAVVDSSLAAISAEDFEAFADLMLPEATAFTVWEQVGELAYRARSREEQRSMDVGDADFLERGFDPEVRVQGHLAMVWLPYDFYTNGQWSHCGVDAFILLRRPEGWRIASIAWTVEQPPACRPHPEGAPAG
jgi:ketosteroid isomerase-like protein